MNPLRVTVAILAVGASLPAGSAAASASSSPSLPPSLGRGTARWIERVERRLGPVRQIEEPIAGKGAAPSVYVLMLGSGSVCLILRANGSTNASCGPALDPRQRAVTVSSGTFAPGGIAPRTYVMGQTADDVASVRVALAPSEKAYMIPAEVADHVYFATIPAKDLVATVASRRLTLDVGLTDGSTLAIRTIKTI